MLNWLFDETDIVARTLESVRFGLEAASSQAIPIPARQNPTDFGRAVGEILSRQTKHLENSDEEILSLRRRLDDLISDRDVLIDENRSLSEPLLHRVKTLEEEQTRLKGQVDELRGENERLRLHVSNLERTNASLEAIVADQKRLIARQHLRLVELAGDEDSSP